METKQIKLTQTVDVVDYSPLKKMSGPIGLKAHLQLMISTVWQLLRSPKGKAFKSLYNVYQSDMQARSKADQPVFSFADWAAMTATHWLNRREAVLSVNGDWSIKKKACAVIFNTNSDMPCWFNALGRHIYGTNKAFGNYRKEVEQNFDSFGKTESEQINGMVSAIVKVENTPEVKVA